MAEAALGRKVIAVAGDARGAGATTLALVLARRLAKSGAKIALVDADFAAPQLATRLGLVIGIGWETVLALPEKTSLWDTMVESIEDRLTVVPLASRSRLAVSGEIAQRLTDCLRDLSEAFDLVLVDVGPISLADPQSSWITSPGNGLDAAILACDVRSAEGERLTTLGRRLIDANIAALGVAENFCA
jgi:MinD-like ATPase involved in chromosome partitioning or flagellar assembly